MLYVDFTAGNKDYKLRLPTRQIVSLEKQLGCNPLSIFGDGDTIPTITTMVYVLYASLQQLNHGISLDDAFNIFDDYLAFQFFGLMSAICFSSFKLYLAYS